VGGDIIREWEKGGGDVGGSAGGGGYMKFDLVLYAKQTNLLKKKFSGLPIACHPTKKKIQKKKSDIKMFWRGRGKRTGGCPSTRRWGYYKHTNFNSAMCGLEKDKVFKKESFGMVMGNGGLWS